MLSFVVSASTAPTTLIFYRQTEFLAVARSDKSHLRKQPELSKLAVNCGFDCVTRDGSIPEPNHQFALE
jgi:hypothetical protein